MTVFAGLTRRLLDGVPFHQHRYAVALDGELCRPPRWLDLGAGTRIHDGWLPPSPEDLVGKARFVVGCDLDRGHLQKNKSLTAAIVADGECLPFADGVFDLVSANMVLEHLGNPSAVFREVGRVLAPGGAFVFVTPNRRHPAVFLMSTVLSPDLRRRVAHWADPTQLPEHIFPTFYRANTVSAIVRLARNVGFFPARLEPFSSLPMYHGVDLGQFAEAVWIRLTRMQPFRPFSSNLLGLLRKPARALCSG